VEFHKTVPPINKTATAQYGKFADLETVLSTVTPHLLKNGLVVSQGFEPSSHNNNPVLVTQLLHVSGAYLVSRLPMVVAGRGKNPLHDWGGSCTYSRRYSLLSILGLTADMDVDGDFADEKPAAKAKPSAAPTVPDMSPEKQPIPEDQYEEMIGAIQGLPNQTQQALFKAFMTRFKIPKGTKIRTAINRMEHITWLDTVWSEYA
tara:strand:+ start:1315 stop:1926 length:612 start_codon:yes stop_codon:yes gene_type:complete